jgi:phosphatidylserine/phosphatidylglycerophosphate/cardiolipin synthase-like enzyme
MTPKGMSTQPPLSHLFFLIDADTSGGNKIAVTGSFNWEIPACRGNDENLLVIHDAQINNLYFQEFMVRYREIK